MMNLKSVTKQGNSKLSLQFKSPKSAIQIPVATKEQKHIFMPTNRRFLHNFPLIRDSRKIINRSRPFKTIWKKRARVFSHPIHSAESRAQLIRIDRN